MFIDLMYKGEIMKIRIKNIFVNKKQSKSGKDKINGKNAKLKKVYDASMKVNNQTDKGSKEEYDEKIEDKLNNVKRRKGYVLEKEKKERKIKIHYDNLVKNKNNLSRGYYVLLFGMFLLGIGSVVFASKTYTLFKEESYQVFNTEDENLQTDETQKQELNLQSEETSNKDTKTVDIAKVATNATTTNNKAKETKVEPLNFVKPIYGDILKVYSKDKVIYSKTLELWKVHDGIDIKVSEGEYIKSIERGTVEKVYEDSFYGVTIVIDHGQGYKSSYSNLDKETLVNEKQTVTKGQKIGKIGNTAIGEIKDESHLHFMLFKNNESEDPTYLFK